MNTMFGGCDAAGIAFRHNAPAAADVADWRNLRLEILELTMASYLVLFPFQSLYSKAKSFFAPQWRNVNIVLSIS
ncbi:MAG: hypothetical protein AMXMBFR84_32490 [Candidatus Hydrogenedentota bacterium]